MDTHLHPPLLAPVKTHEGIDSGICNREEVSGPYQNFNPASGQLSPWLEAVYQPLFYLPIEGEGEPSLDEDNIIKTSTFFIYNVQCAIYNPRRINRQTMETNAADPDTEIIT